MNKKAQERITTNMLEVIILIIIIVFMSYASFNSTREMNTNINKVRAQDLALAISLVAGGEDNIRFDYNLEGEKSIKFYGNGLEISNKDGKYFEKSNFNLGNVKFNGKDDVYTSLSVSKTQGEVTVK